MHKIGIRIHLAFEIRVSGKVARPVGWRDDPSLVILPQIVRVFWKFEPLLILVFLYCVEKVSNRWPFKIDLNISQIAEFGNIWHKIANLEIFSKIHGFLTRKVSFMSISMRKIVAPHNYYLIRLVILRLLISICEKFCAQKFSDVIFYMRRPFFNLIPRERWCVVIWKHMTQYFGTFVLVQSIGNIVRDSFVIKRVILCCKLGFPQELECLLWLPLCELWMIHSCVYNLRQAHTREKFRKTCWVSKGIQLPRRCDPYLESVPKPVTCHLKIAYHILEWRTSFVGRNQSAMHKFKLFQKNESFYLRLHGYILCTIPSSEKVDITYCISVCLIFD